MSNETMRDEPMTDAQAFGFLSETDTTIEQEAAIRHLRARLRGEAPPEGQAVAYHIQHPDGLVALRKREAVDEHMVEQAAADGIVIRPLGFADLPQPAAPESDEQYADAEALIAHLDALVDDGGQGGEKWQPAQAAIAGILSWQNTGSPVAAPAPVAGDALAREREIRFLAGSIVRNLEKFDGAWCGLLDDALLWASQIEKATAALAQDRASQAGAAGAVPDWMLIVQRSDAECLVRDHERFTTHESSTAGGRLAAKRVRAMLAAAPTPAAEREVGNG